MPSAAELLREGIWDSLLHPRAQPGSSAGGQFTSGSSGSGGGRSKGGHGGGKKRAGAAPKGLLAYDPKTNTGPGYDLPHGDPRVHQLQQALNRLGAADGRGHQLADDGRLGPLTTQAVKTAQTRLGLKPTGRVTPALLKRLLAAKMLTPARKAPKRRPAPRPTKGRRGRRMHASMTAADLLFGDAPAGAVLPVRDRASYTAAQLLHGDSVAVAVLEGWDPAKHPRIPKGQPGAGKFLSLLDRAKAAIAGHGNAKGDPLHGFNHDQLRRIAKTSGIHVTRGTSRDDLAKAVHQHLTPSTPIPAPHATVNPRTPAVVNALDVIGGTHPKAHTVTTRLQVYGRMRGSDFQVLAPQQQHTMLAHLQQIANTSKGGNKVRANQLIWRFTPAGTPAGAVPTQTVHVPAAAKATHVAAPTPHGTPGLLKLAHDRGRAGDGWSRNPDGSSGPWGKYGAAGLMLSHVGTDGKRRYLMVQRGPAISDPGKWQFPGGAIDSKETAHEGATRETIEELGFKPDALKDALVHGEHVHSIPGGWKYTSIAATVPTQLTPDLSTHHARAETSDAKWMTAEEINTLDKQGKLLAPLASGKLQSNVMSLFPPAHPTGALPPPAPPIRHKPSRGVDLLATAAAKDKLRQDVKNARVKYDGKTADGRLAAIGAMQGYDDVPTVVSKKEMDRLVATGDYIEVWRGVRGAGSSGLAGGGRGGGTVSKTKTAADINEEMRSGPAYYGKGIFGNGYYLAESKSVAQQYSDGTKNSVVRVLIPKDATVIEHAEAMREATMIASPYSKAKGNRYEDGTLWDEGRYAAAKGYAGIRIPHTSRNRSSTSASHVASPSKAAWNWLDRSTLIVQEAQR